LKPNLGVLSKTERPKKNRKSEDGRAGPLGRSKRVRGKKPTCPSYRACGHGHGPENKKAKAEVVKRRDECGIASNLRGESEKPENHSPVKKRQVREEQHLGANHGSKSSMEKEGDKGKLVPCLTLIEEKNGVYKSRRAQCPSSYARTKYSPCKTWNEKRVCREKKKGLNVSTNPCRA